MTELLIRLIHPEGKSRLLISNELTFDDLLLQISQKTGIEKTNIRISIDSKTINCNPTTKIRLIREFQEGIMLQIIPFKPILQSQQQQIKKSEQKIEEEHFPRCDHGPKGRCLNCPQDPKVQIPEEVKPKKKEETKIRCNHGSNAKCINCPEVEVKKEFISTTVDRSKCQHGDKGRCFNCMNKDKEGIKHLAFDDYLDQNYAKCKNHAPHQKCTNCLIDLELDYKINMNCKNHEPYPKGLCSNCIPPSIEVSRQPYRHVDYAQFNNFTEISNLIKYWLENINQRVGVVYGYFAEDPVYDKGVRALIEAIYEPPQENTFNNSTLLTDPFQKLVDQVANALGFEKIGWVFTTHNKDVFLSSEEMIKASQIQQNFTIKHPCGVNVSKQVSIVLRADQDKNNSVTPEVYMISDQGQAMVRDRLIEEPESRKYLKIKTGQINKFTPKFMYQGKNVNQIEPDFFLVNVAHGQPLNTKFNIIQNYDFPVANRKKPQNPIDVRDYLRNNKHLKSYQIYANFHLLIYLAKMLDIHTVITICDCIKAEQEVPDQIGMMIDNYIQHGKQIN